MTLTGTLPPDRAIRRYPRRLLKPTERREDVVRRASYAALVASMAAEGINTVPIFLSPAKPDGTHEILDGNSRFYGAEDNDIDELVGIEVDEDLDEAGLIEFGAKVNGVRRTLAPEQFGRMAESLMQVTGCTQEEAARRLLISPASLSRALASLLMPERHRAATAGLAPSIRTSLAAEPEGPVLDALVEFATKVGPNGKLPTRDAVELHRKQLRGGKQKGRPKTRLEAKTAPGGVVESFRFRADATPVQLAQQLRSVADLIDKHSADGMKAILALIEARKPGKGSATPPTT